MRHEIQVHLSQRIPWAHQLELLVPGQIAHDDRSESAVREEEAQGTAVPAVGGAAGDLGSMGFEICTQGIGGALTLERRLQYRTARRDDAHVQAVDRD